MEQENSARESDSTYKSLPKREDELLGAQDGRRMELGQGEQETKLKCHGDHVDRGHTEDVCPCETDSCCSSILENDQTILAQVQCDTLEV